MKRRIFRYLKHVISTFLILAIIAVIFGLSIGASAKYGESPLMMVVDKDGPYVFYKNDSILNVKYVRGNRVNGFYVNQKDHPINKAITASCYLQFDSSQFDFTIINDFKTPSTTYNDSGPILAISDIESGYRTFRNFLINNKVIDKNLNWTFGNGHLVLVGDFVDRGNSTTQVLWFIYKLEQDAKKQGGFVHFILGNHELKNMQGRYKSASPKYLGVSSILEKQPHDLYGSHSFIGKWMASKNTLELINGNLFAHGGLHPDVANSKLSLDELNQRIRENYFKGYFPKVEKSIDELLISTKTGICWYRGYFKDDLTQEQVDAGLRKFNAKSITVGHTLQSKVNRKFNGRVIGIDVKHSKDYRKSWPNQESEGLLIKGDKYFRVLANGDKEEI